MKELILKLLLEANSHISGEDMSKVLGISRTAVWKHINKLKEEGYDISSVRNKGYLIKQETSELVRDRVVSHIKANSIFQTIEVFESVGSTNDEAKKLLAQADVKEGLVVAREQLKGKGRRGRIWASEKDKGVYMSLMLRPDIEPIHASMLTLLAGVAVSRAIKALYDLDLQIKWPNDLVLNGKKVCGILTEMSAEMDYIHYVIVGIGVNVNQQIFDDEIKEIATSLRKESGVEYNRPELIGGVLEVFEDLYKVYLQEKDLSFVIDEYNSRCVNVGQDLKVIGRNETITGKGQKVNKDGTLVIVTEQGEEVTIQSGEVSVRGLYGYV